MKAKKVDAQWHAAHVMPQNATRARRIRWHAEHAETCGCRPVPPGIEAEVAMLMKGASS